MKELNQPTDSECFEFLRLQQCLPQVNVLDDLEGDQLGDVHGVGAATLGRSGLSQIPPIFTQDRRVLITLQGLRISMRVQRESVAYLKYL